MIDRFETRTTFNKYLSGFAFLEMMLLTAIIGLVLAIALPNYLDARARATKNICRSNQKIIYTAATMYMLQESDSLEEKGGNKARLQALIDKEYLRGDKWCDCPSSADGSYDDYTMIFENGFVSDVECAVNPSAHKWP